MKVRYVEGLAIHSGPESCAGTREGVSDALTGGYAAIKSIRSHNKSYVK